MPFAPDLTGRALDGRYELHELIGEGTFGRVYRGRDRRLARPVAVKVIKPWWADDPEWVRSFEREAQLLARVNDPGIVQIFDVGVSGEGLYYVAELVEGESLASRLRAGPLPALDACQLGEQLCRALAQAHAKRVVHRDIKPANVLISTDGRVKVGDFGVARLAEGSSDGDAASIAGTPRYMAPEQARGLATTPATDVYGAGIVLYEMLAGRTPFTESSAVELALRHLQDPPPPLPATVPKALDGVVMRALAKDPKSRYRDGGAMADALARARASITPEAVERLARGTTTRGPATLRANGSARGAQATRIAARWSPRRTVNTADRRHTRLISAVVAALLVGMVAAAVVIALGGGTRVPVVRGLSRAAAAVRLRGVGLRPAFASRYDQAAAGIAIAQVPRAGANVGDGATIRVMLSAGPPPVPVPSLVGQGSVDAQSALGRLGLRAAVSHVPAPGTAPGTVVGQAPPAGSSVSRGATVALSLAETPQWRALTSIASQNRGVSVPFRIRGQRWRIVYGMHYQGTCTLIFICSGPTAHVARLKAGSFTSQFDLSEGDAQIRGLASGPGVYQITVTPGSDTARWSLRVEDYY
jgi:hypothetical protein